MTISNSLFKLRLLLFGLLSHTCYSQQAGGLIQQEFNKEFSVYEAKVFAINNLIGEVLETPTKFKVDPLDAAETGELTTLYFNCEKSKTEGLILNFYGKQITSAGVLYNRYGFKFLPKGQAVELLNKIEEIQDKESDYIWDDANNHNLVFKYEDLIIILYRFDGRKLRVLWNGFDSEWERSGFRNTRKRFLREAGY